MSDDLHSLLGAPMPTSARPLLGITVLVVEDSRFACEAMRLLCLRSGARIRRADCLKSARRHLRAYRPSVVIVDLGLPDGSGAELIDELAHGAPRVDVLLATSGDAGNEALGRIAGADGFIEKPIESLAAFQEIVLSHLPEGLQPAGPRALPTDVITPDPVAFRDDMAHVADVLTAGSDDATIDYVAQFLEGVARSAHDADLESAASSLARHRAAGQSTRSDLAKVAGLVQDRLEGRQAV